jgi:protein-disulfide isomerase
VAAAAPATPPVDRAEALKRAAEPGDSPVRGNPRAPVTIISYSEFQCPFCARVQPTLRDLLAAYPEQVRLIWKHLPLPFHEGAGLAAEATMAAGEQGKFWEMHDRLFANQERLDPAALEEHAKALGLDVAQFKAALDSGKFRKRVEADAQLAKDAGINGTPSFLINGEPLTGNQPLEAFKQKVEEALARAKGLPPPERKIAARPAGPPSGPRAMPSPYWPPPAVTLPDAMLGERLGVPFSIARAPMRGNPKGPVEILYFTAVGCSYECDKAASVLAGLLATYGEQVRVIAKLVPFGGGGRDTPPIYTEAALAAHAQGKFWEFHDKLTKESGFPPPDRAKLESLAQEVGLDLDDFRAALDDGRFRAAALEEMDAINGARIGATAFVVNGRVADGTVALVKLVENAIRKAGRKPPAWPTGGMACETNPRAAGYDPSRLLMTGAVSPRQLFGYEPREEAWAGPIEKDLGAMIDKDLRAMEPKMAGSSLDCRTSLCRLRWKPGKGDPKLLERTVNFVYQTSGGTRPAAPGSNELYLVVRGPHGGGGTSGGTPEAVIGRIRSRRSTLLYNLRTGRVTQPPPIPLERLPKE